MISQTGYPRNGLGLRGNVAHEMSKHYRLKFLGLSLAALLGMSSCTLVPGSPGAERVETGGPLAGSSAPSGDTQYFPGFRPVSGVSVDSAQAEAGTVFLGSVFPGNGRADLSFYGFNAAKTAWRVDTNPSCVGTVVTEVNGEPAVVILDSDARTDGQGPVSVVVATAFAADDAEVLWGPTRVPGPSAGSGLIFTDTPKALTADPPPGVLLDADTGAVVEVGTGTALYEHHGTALAGSETSFSALDTGSGNILWSSADLRRPAGADPEAAVRFTGAYGPSTGGIVVLEWDAGDAEPVPVAYSLRSGEELGQVPGEPAAAAAVDEATGTVLLTSEARNGSRVLRAFRPGAGLLWRKSFDEARVSSIGGGAVFALLNGVAARIDVESGAILDTGDARLPVSVLPNGTALFPTRKQSTFALAVPDGPAGNG
ncbi:hypothetical protein SAMN04489742_4810 [Arthrobacter crystallopoietes]|uniref:PQQ-like domain-containing protein n=2 Tax=Crystallibacter crystallopoietes TaxID=37928 RepID=A0A1H1HYJ0_9MICC|nr:hypothetical protein SAMN04489742_4810 [Arthrobacter crystallopoietes]